MLKVFLVILLAGVFLGGYYVGRLPGSPDLLAWGRETFNSTGPADCKPKGLSPTTDDSLAERRRDERPGKILVEIEGKTYLIGE